MKFKSFILISLVFFANAGIADGGVLVLPPIIVEGQRTSNPEVPKNRQTLPITVKTGVGAKNLDVPMNELGIPLVNSEESEELILNRPPIQWLLSDPKISNYHKKQIQFNFLGTQSTQLHLGIEFGQMKILLESGFLQDYQWYQFRENTQNPFDNKKGKVSKLKNELSKNYVKLNLKKLDFQFQVDSDFQEKKLLPFSSTIEGRLKQSQQTIGSSYEYSLGQALVYARTSQTTLLSDSNKINSNLSEGNQFGASFKLIANNRTDFLEPGIFVENLRIKSMSKSQSNNDISKFNSFTRDYQRNSININGNKIYSFGGFNSHLNFKTEWANDIIFGQKSIENQFGWDIGLEVLSSKNFFQDFYKPSKKQKSENENTINDDTIIEPSNSEQVNKKFQANDYGWVFRGRPYNRLIKPSQRFGDGIFLEASPDLENESGIRGSMGPWLEIGELHFEITPFFENTKNAPVVIPNSPTSSKTISIGSIMSRGFEIQTVSNYRQSTVKINYSFQETLNNSEISWQRGHAIPGRPKHTFTSEYNNEYNSHWSFGGSYEFKSEEPLDLAELWQKAPHHKLNTFIGYKNKNWATRLIGKNLLAAKNEVPMSVYSGNASADLLEPTIEQTEVNLLCEILL